MKNSVEIFEILITQQIATSNKRKSETCDYRNRK